MSASRRGVRRGKQRWSALVSAPTSRLAANMRPRLGEALWADFVAHANAHYKEAFVNAFDITMRSRPWLDSEFLSTHG